MGMWFLIHARMKVKRDPCLTMKFCRMAPTAKVFFIDPSHVRSEPDNGRKRYKCNILFYWIMLFLCREIAHLGNFICCILHPNLNKKYLVSSDLIWSDLIWSHPISSHPISPHLIWSDLIWSHHLISSHLISSHFVLSYLILLHAGRFGVAFVG